MVVGGKIVDLGYILTGLRKRLREGSYSITDAWDNAVAYLGEYISQEEYTDQLQKERCLEGAQDLTKKARALANAMRETGLSAVDIVLDADDRDLFGINAFNLDERGNGYAISYIVFATLYELARRGTGAYAIEAREVAAARNVCQNVVLAAEWHAQSGDSHIAEALLETDDPKKWVCVLPADEGDDDRMLAEKDSYYYPGFGPLAAHLWVHLKVPKGATRRKMTYYSEGNIVEVRIQEEKANFRTKRMSQSVLRGLLNLKLQLGPLNEVGVSGLASPAEYSEWSDDVNVLINDVNRGKNEIGKWLIYHAVRGQIKARGGKDCKGSWFSEKSNNGHVVTTCLEATQMGNVAGKIVSRDDDGSRLMKIRSSHRIGSIHEGPNGLFIRWRDIMKKEETRIDGLEYVEWPDKWIGAAK